MRRRHADRAWPDFATAFAGRLGDFGHGRFLRLHLAGRLVLAQPLERSLPDIAAVGKACEFDLGDELGLQPMHVAGLARRILAAERAFVGGCRLQRRHDPPDRVLPEAGADDADKGQMIAAIDAGHQRAEFAVGGLPAAEHDLLSGAAFGLGPALGAAGAIGRSRASWRRCLPATACAPIPGWRRHRLRNARHSGSIRLCVLGRASSSCFNRALRSPKRQAAQVFAVGEQQIERIEDQIVGLAVRKGGLQAWRNPARRCGRARRSRHRSARRAARLPPSRSPRICRSSPGLCGFSSGPRHPRRATARGSRRI